MPKIETVITPDVEFRISVSARFVTITVERDGVARNVSGRTIADVIARLHPSDAAVIHARCVMIADATADAMADAACPIVCDDPTASCPNRIDENGDRYDGAPGSLFARVRSAFVRMHVPHDPRD